MREVWSFLELPEQYLQADLKTSVTEFRAGNKNLQKAAQNRF
jgi:hypothetical protein